MTTHKQLRFNFSGKETLNSNRMPNQFVVKSKMANYIREQGAKKGLENHDHPQLAEERYNQILDAAELSVRKARITKRLNKMKASTEEIDEAIQKVIREFNSRSNNTEPVEVPVMFYHFRITVTILAPTKRRIDPPNFYPTVKALVDGLSDASWWDDDDFSHLVETTFHYGGLSGIKDTYTIVLDIESVDPTQYVTMPEIQTHN